MSAYNHRFKALEQREQFRNTNRDVHICSRCRTTTSRPRQPAVILACYDYVTGKSGRVTTSEVYVCREHAESYARKHKLDLNAQMLGLKHYFIEKMKDYVVKQVPLDEASTRAYILTWEQGGNPLTPMEAGVHEACNTIVREMARSTSNG